MNELMNRLNLMDCMEGMKQFPDKYFDLAIVDPPYGIGMSNKKSSTSGMVKQKSGNYLKVNAVKYINKFWDCKTPNKEYFNELFRISKNQIIWGGNYFIEHLYNTKCFILWDKLNKNNKYSDFEMAWTSFDRGCKKLDYLWDGFSQGKNYIEGSIQQGNKKLNEKRIHPTQKPTMVYRWLLQNYAKKGDKILDTHVGSGSSLIACIEEGFEYCGFEIDEDYYNSAQKRIEEVQAQGKLFAPQ